MQATEIAEYARKLKEAHGQRAVVEAGQKARICREQGKVEEAATWERVEAALLVTRGPHQG